MIFEITDELIESKDSNFIKCLDNLLLGYEEGNHSIVIRPLSVEKIYAIYDDKIDDRLRARLTYYEETSMYESKNFINFCSEYFRLVDKNSIEEIIEEEEHNIRMVKIDNFLKSSTIQKTHILGENENDCFIYALIGEVFLMKNSLSNRLSISFSQMPGGGNTTGSIFKNKIINNEAPCLCILDSDKKFPSDSSLGLTAKTVKKEVRKVITPKYKYYILEKCRELENILPEGFYYKYYSEDVNKIPIFSKLDEINSIDDKLIYFHDMKDGLKHFTIRNQADWVNLQNVTFISTSTKCASEGSCSKKDTCSYKVVESFGDKILKDFQKFYNNISTYQFKLIINSSQQLIKEIWDEIGKMIFSWCCGYGKQVSNS